MPAVEESIKLADFATVMDVAVERQLDQLLQVTETKQYMQGPCMYMYMHAGETEGPAPRLVAPSDPVRRKAAARPMAGGLSAMEPGSQVHKVLGTPSGCCSMRSGTSTAPSSL